MAFLRCGNQLAMIGGKKATNANLPGEAQCWQVDYSADITFTAYNSDGSIISTSSGGSTSGTVIMTAVAGRCGSGGWACDQNSPTFDFCGVQVTPDCEIAWAPAGYSLQYSSSDPPEGMAVASLTYVNLEFGVNTITGSNDQWSVSGEVDIAFGAWVPCNTGPGPWYYTTVSAAWGAVDDIPFCTKSFTIPLTMASAGCWGVITEDGISDLCTREVASCSASVTGSMTVTLIDSPCVVTQTCYGTSNCVSVAECGGSEGCSDALFPALACADLAGIVGGDGCAFAQVCLTHSGTCQLSGTDTNGCGTVQIVYCNNSYFPYKLNVYDFSDTLVWSGCSPSVLGVYQASLADGISDGPTAIRVTAAPCPCPTSGNQCCTAFQIVLAGTEDLNGSYCLQFSNTLPPDLGAGVTWGWESLSDPLTFLGIGQAFLIDSCWAVQFHNPSTGDAVIFTAPSDATSCCPPTDPSKWSLYLAGSGNTGATISSITCVGSCVSYPPCTATAMATTTCVKITMSGWVDGDKVCMNASFDLTYDAGTGTYGGWDGAMCGDWVGYVLCNGDGEGDWVLYIEEFAGGHSIGSLLDAVLTGGSNNSPVGATGSWTDGTNTVTISITAC